MSTTLISTHDHPLVWDNEHDETMIGIDGHGYTAEDAQRHVDRAMTEDWGIRDARFVVEHVSERDAMTDPISGEDIGPWTLVRGEYVDQPAVR